MQEPIPGPKPRVVYIIPGFAEGEWHTKKMRYELIRRGYIITATPETADTIIAHSGGCWLIPQAAQPKIVLHINPSPWSGPRTWAKAMSKKVVHDLTSHLAQKQLFHWIDKTLWNFSYLFTTLPATRQMYKAGRNYDMSRLFVASKKTIVVQNHDDPWDMSRLKEVTKEQKGAEFLRIPGGHDDCWDNPAKYLDLLI